MFRNLQIYRLPNGISASPDDLAAQLAKTAFRPCGASDRFSHGWVEPHAGTGLVFAQEKQRVLCFQSEDKILPASYVHRCAQAKVDEIEAAQGYKPGRKQMRDILEAVEAELLPRAFTKMSRSMVWIDNDLGWLGIDGSPSRADDVIELLARSMDMIPQIAPVRTTTFVGSAMTSWIAGGEAPGVLTIDRDCELAAKTGEMEAVKYRHSNLDNDDVRNHIAAGKSATRLALTWNNRVSFVLTERMEIKRISLVDIIKDQAAEGANDADELFAADVALYTGELAAVIAAVVDACDGLADEIDDMAGVAKAAKNIDDLLREDGTRATLTDGSGNELATFGDGPDPLYEQAKDLVIKERRASISLVQRHLRIGYNRAARLIEAMEKNGVVSAQDESGSRTVLTAAATEGAA